MAGFREFVTGEVLTAANVDDFLAKQAVMKFADAAARDSALGTAVAGGNALREGMVAYLDDTDEVLKYDGSSWKDVGGKILQVVTATNSTETTTASLTFVPTGLSATITPSATSSKVLIFANTNVENASAAGACHITLFRGTVSDTNLGNATFGMGAKYAGVNSEGVIHVNFLDSPSTASAQTYTLAFRVDGNTSKVQNRGALASMTLVEVAA